MTPEIDSEGLVQQKASELVIKSQFYRKLWNRGKFSAEYTDARGLLSLLRKIDNLKRAAKIHCVFHSRNKNACKTKKEA